ncbi:MAG: hypothetical protein WCI23_06965 [Chlorobiaceae bacterium]|jgi:predicted  nucleic acid-binding Zn-ribbon protein
MHNEEEVYSREAVSENYADSGEVRIQKIQNAFQTSENIKESCHFLVDSVEESLEYLKERRIDVSSKLCDALAKKESLRKKDYNSIMDDIYRMLDEKENNAKSQFINFIEDQKEFTQSLKNIIVNITDYSTTDSTDKITVLKEELSQIAEIQEKRKESVIKTLTDFQEIHKKVMEYLESLLEKGDNINIRDIKKAKYIIS